MDRVVKTALTFIQHHARHQRTKSAQTLQAFDIIIPVLQVSTQGRTRAKQFPQILQLVSARARTRTQVHLDPVSVSFFGQSIRPRGAKQHPRVGHSERAQEMLNY